MTGFEGTPFRTKKNATLGLTGKRVKAVGKAKDRPYIIYKDTFWYFTASCEKMSIKIVKFSFFFFSNPKIFKMPLKVFL